MSTGLLDAGYDVRLGVDNDRPSLVTYEHNHDYRGGRSLLADVAQISGEQLLAEAGVDRLDLLSGGPPCQPFSIAGKRLGLKDPRAKLVGEFLRLVEEMMPQGVLLENVPALARAHDGAVLTGIVETLTNLGYHVQYSVLNAASYGVPQNRRRLVVAGLRDVTFPFPPPETHGPDGGLLFQPFATAWDALHDLPDVDDERAAEVPNHEPTVHTDAMVRAFRSLRPGEREPGSYHDRLHQDRPGYTVRAGSGNFSPLRPVHYEHHRVLTVRESARLQGFSDLFVWPDSVSRLQQYRQVGNAVPPPLARAVGEHLARAAGWMLDPGLSKGDASARPDGLTMTADERRANRARYRHGGASTGKRADIPA
jgi:DNA (cytosine-5)-methyltransferase 1